jgi:hypothetical protein
MPPGKAGAAEGQERGADRLSGQRREPAGLAGAVTWRAVTWRMKRDGPRGSQAEATRRLAALGEICSGCWDARTQRLARARGLPLPRMLKCTRHEVTLVHWAAFCYNVCNTPDAYKRHRAGLGAVDREHNSDPECETQSRRTSCSPGTSFDRFRMPVERAFPVSEHGVHAFADSHRVRRRGILACNAEPGHDRSLPGQRPSAVLDACEMRGHLHPASSDRSEPAADKKAETAT